MRRRDTDRHGNKVYNTKLNKRGPQGGRRAKDVKPGRKVRNCA